MPRLPAKLSVVKSRKSSSLELKAGGLPQLDETNREITEEENAEQQEDDDSPKLPTSEAEAIIETIEQKKLARRTAEIQERLNDINGRISKTLGSYEMVEALAENQANLDVEFVRDMQELTAIATDSVKKRKYMKEVAVFIVGFDAACEQRLVILEQLEAFFQEQEKKPGIDHDLEDDDIDKIAQSVEGAIHFTEESMGKLGDLNKEMIVALENAVVARERARGNQRMKKQIDKLKEENDELNAKLGEVQADNEVKAEEIERLSKQMIELKQMADRAKQLKAELKDKTEECERLKEELTEARKDLAVKDNRIESLVKEVEHERSEKERIQDELHSVIAVKQEMIDALEEQLRELNESHARELEELKESHRHAMEEQKGYYEHEMNNMANNLANKASSLQNELDEERRKFDQLQREAATMSQELDQLKNKRVITEDDIGPPFDLRDEPSWNSVADDELRARYNQYRKLAMTHITQLEEQVSAGAEAEKQMTERFFETEKKWNAERQLLLDQAEQADNARKQAEREAEQAWAQLEAFLDDIEKLHQMRDYTRLEARHYRKLDADMQEQFMKTLSPYAKEALNKQLNELPGDVNFAVQTEEVIREARKAISDMRAGSRRQQRSAEAQIRVDPMLSEYLRTYDFVHNFKNTISTLFKQRSVESVGVILDEIEVINFDKDENCFQQIAEMQQQLIILLGEIVALVLRMLFQSKLDHRGLDYFKTNLPDLVPRSIFAEIDQSVLSGGAELRKLQEEYARLKEQSEIEKKDLDDKLQRSENENDNLRRQIHDLMQRLEDAENRLAELEAERSAVLFTRLDAERNQKNLKRAIQFEKIDAETFEQATDLIDKYTRLPSQRLANLVSRYVNHCSMKLIQENIRRMTSKDGAHIQLIHNFERLQEKRESQWSAVSAGLAAERQSLAKELTERMESIEIESGIFLIKPMFSYRAKLKERRARNSARSTDTTSENPHKPSTFRRPAVPPRVKNPQHVPDLPSSRPWQHMASHPMAPSGYHDNEMVGAGLISTEKYQRMWNADVSKAAAMAGDDAAVQLGTPKMLELDINRFMMDQNNISSPMRIVTKIQEQAGLAAPRSYLTVSRTIPDHYTTGEGKDAASRKLPPLVK